MLKIEVHLYTQSLPAVHENVRNAYQKGSLYCIMQQDGVVVKYPIEHIFRVKEYEVV